MLTLESLILTVPFAHLVTSARPTPMPAWTAGAVLRLIAGGVVLR